MSQDRSDIHGGAEQRPSAIEDEVSEEDRKRAVALMHGFCALNQACRLYDMNNEVVKRVLEDMRTNIHELSKGKEPVYLTTAAHSFFLNRALVPMGYTEYQKAQKLKEIWGKLGISEVVFPGDVTMEGLVQYATMVISAIKDPSKVPELTRREWGGVTSHMVMGGSNEEIASEEDDLICELAVRVYCGLIVLVMETLEQFQQNKWTTLLRVKRSLQVLVDKLEYHEGLLVALTTSSVYRETLAAHLTNTAILTLILGRRLNLGRRDLIALATAALFHDISKVSLKPKTLNTLENVGQLQPEDRQRVQMHWMNTLSQLVRVGGFAGETLPRVVVGFESQLEFSHGRLYPDEMGLKHPHSFFAHIISMCDRYDTLLWSRVDKKAITPHRAVLTLLHTYQKQYHPSLLDMFVRSIGLFPTGSLVRLSSNELAVVSSQDPEGNPELPTLNLISEPDGTALPRGVELNLAADGTRSIKHAEDPQALGINPVSIFISRDDQFADENTPIGRLILATRKIAKEQQQGQ